MKWRMFLSGFLVMAPTLAIGQMMQTAPSTPDISVSAGATLDVKFTVPYVDQIYLKNDCGTTLYFNLRPDDRSASDYPLRLDTKQAFTSPLGVRIATLGVSNDGASACPFTLQGFYK